MITKIVQQISPALALSATVYQDNGLPPLNGNIDYWLPLLKAQTGQLEAIFSQSGGKKIVTFDMNGNAHNWNTTITTLLNGDSVSSSLPWEYIFNMTDGNGKPIARLWNDNQAAGGTDNGNSATNAFFVPETTPGSQVGAINGYAVVIPKISDTFANDYVVSFAGGGTGVFTSAVVDPNNSGQWLVIVHWTSMFASNTPVSDPTAYGTALIVKIDAIGTTFQNSVFFAKQAHADAGTAKVTGFVGTNNLLLDTASENAGFNLQQTFDGVDGNNLVTNGGKAGTKFNVTFVVPKTLTTFAADWSIVHNLLITIDTTAPVASGSNWDVTLTGVLCTGGVSADAIVSNILLVAAA